MRAAAAVTAAAGLGGPHSEVGFVQVHQVAQPEPLRCAAHARETRLTCVTCGRPICADCLVQTPVGFKCYDDARGARVIFGYDFLKDRRAARSAARILVWMIPLLLLLVFRVGAGVGAGVGPSGLIPSIAASVLISIILTLGIRWLSRRL